MSLRTSLTLKVTGASQSAKWETSRQKVATVTNGKVTAVGLGSCKIFATANGVKLTFTVQVRSNEKNWKVVTRPGAYQNAMDDYFISKVRRNANGSITVEGYFVNTHKYNITSFDYMYLAVRDSNDNLIGDYKMPKFGFRASSYSVNLPEKVSDRYQQEQYGISGYRRRPERAGTGTVRHADGRRRCGSV